MNNQNITEVGVLIFFFLYFSHKGYKFLFGRKYKLLHKKFTEKKLKALPWDDFELLCGEYFRSQGWKVRMNEKHGADGGIDLHMKKKRKTSIVQCKRYGDALVTIKVVREMLGLQYEHEADSVYIITSNRFTKECYKFVSNKNITLINGKDLLTLLKNH